MLICYESIFPDLSRREVNRGADVLVNITNDAWYGESSAPYQLLAMAAMRAVETKVPMVRVANTGISVDHRRRRERSRRARRCSSAAPRSRTCSWRPRRTVYTMVGDLFAEICFVLTLVGVLLAVLRPAPARKPYRWRRSLEPSIATGSS